MRNFAFGDMAELPQAAQLVVAVSHYHPASEAASMEIHGPKRFAAATWRPSHSVGQRGTSVLAYSIIEDGLFRRAGSDGNTTANNHNREEPTRYKNRAI
jgi:hypothetical protein